jgi:hypothetical protein
MLEHFTAQNHIKRLIRFGNIRDVAYQINVTGIPRACLKTRGIPAPFVLAKVLGYIG